MKLARQVTISFLWIRVFRAAYLDVFDESIFDQFVAIHREGDVIGFIYGLAFNGINGKAVFCPMASKSNRLVTAPSYNCDHRTAIRDYHSYRLGRLSSGSDTDTAYDVVRFCTLPHPIQLSRPGF